MGKKNNSPFCLAFPDFFCAGKKVPNEKEASSAFFTVVWRFSSRVKGGKECASLSILSLHVVSHTIFSGRRGIFTDFLIISFSYSQQKCRLLPEHHSPQNSAAISTLKQRQQQRQQQLRNRHRHTFLLSRKKTLLFSAIYFSAHSNTKWLSLSVPYLAGDWVWVRNVPSSSSSFQSGVHFPLFSADAFLEERRTQKRRRSFT